MTKKDYILIGDELRKLYNGCIHPAVKDALCDAFKKDNPKFDRQKWLDYLAKK